MKDRKIKKIVRRFSPYKVTKVFIEKVYHYDGINEEPEDLNNYLIVVSVYTKNKNKDFSLMFNSDSIAMSKLPDNFLVRYL